MSQDAHAEVREAGRSSAVAREHGRSALVVGVIVSLLAALPATAHEVLHLVERSRAVAVKAYESDGEVLAGAAYEVYSPADPRTPYQAGRTDRGGWLAFVPDVEGKWRVRVLDASGHGLDVEVDAAAVTAAGTQASGVPSAAALALRPLAGVAAIVAIFAALFAARRRKRSGP